MFIDAIEKNKGWGSNIIISNEKDMLLETLAKVAHVIGKIIKDPIGFLSNLIAAVKMGLDNFVKNIMDHMKKGLIAWLLGLILFATGLIYMPLVMGLVALGAWVDRSVLRVLARIDETK